MGKRFEFVLQEMERLVSFTRPPLLDDKNYYYWKVRIKAYIKGLDEKAWGAILTGWSLPTVTTSEGKLSNLRGLGPK